MQRQQYRGAYLDFDSLAESTGVDSEGESSSDDLTGAKDLVRASRVEAVKRAKAERRAQRKAKTAEMARQAEKRRKKEIKLNRLSSISASGGRDIPGRIDKGDR